MATTQQRGLAYVNLQTTPVRVYDADRRPITVMPWVDRHRQQGTYVVHGAHYQQFVSGAGPLYSFPGPPSALDAEGQPVVHAGAPPDSTVYAASPRAADDQKRSAMRGRMRIAADVVRAGETVGESSTVFIARVRRELAQQGVLNALSFSQASSHVLLQCPSVNSDNLPRVRESVRDIFPEDTSVPPPDVSAAATGLLADEGVVALRDLDTTADDFKEGEGEGEGEGGDDVPSRTYSRAQLQAMTKPQLVEVVERENFEIDTSKKKAVVQQELLTGLAQYKMLED